MAVRQFNEIHNFTSSFILQQWYFIQACSSMHFVCLSIYIDYSKFQSRSVSQRGAAGSPGIDWSVAVISSLACLLWKELRLQL